MVVFFVLGAAAFLVTRPEVVLSPAAAAVFRARGLEVLALVPLVALAAADLTFFVAVVAVAAVLLLFLVVAGRACSGAAVGTKGTRGAVIPLLPRVAAGMVMERRSVLEDVRDVWRRETGWRIG